MITNFDLLLVLWEYCMFLVVHRCRTDKPPSFYPTDYQEAYQATLYLLRTYVFFVD